MQVQREVVKAAIRSYGEDSQETLEHLLYLGDALRHTGDTKQARVIDESVLRASVRGQMDIHFQLACMTNLLEDYILGHNSVLSVQLISKIADVASRLPDGDLARANLRNMASRIDIHRVDILKSASVDAYERALGELKML